MPIETIQRIAQNIFSNNNFVASTVDELKSLETQLENLHIAHGFHSWFANLYFQHNLPSENWLPSVREQYFKNELQNAIFAREYQNLTTKLHSARSEYTPLKGLWLTQNLLPQTGLRTSGDVDLWVDTHTYKNITPLMQEALFYTRDTLHHRFHFHKEFRKKIGSSNIIFEMHRELTLNSYICINSEQVWREAKRTQSGLIELQPHHQLIYIFCHSAIHGFDRLSRLYDLPLVFNWALSESLNTDELMTCLTFWRCRKMFLFSLLALEWLLNKKIASDLFTTSEIAQVKPLLAGWLAAIENSNLINSHKVHRRHLTDNHWQTVRGLLHPQRLIGAFIDRMGYY